MTGKITSNASNIPSTTNSRVVAKSNQYPNMADKTSEKTDPKQYPQKFLDQIPDECWGSDIVWKQCAHHLETVNDSLTLVLVSRKIQMDVTNGILSNLYHCVGKISADQSDFVLTIPEGAVKVTKIIGTGKNEVEVYQWDEENYESSRFKDGDPSSGQGDPSSGQGDKNSSIDFEAPITAGKEYRKYKNIFDTVRAGFRVLNPITFNNTALDYGKFIINPVNNGTGKIKSVEVTVYNIIHVMKNPDGSLHCGVRYAY